MLNRRNASNLLLFALTLGCGVRQGTWTPPEAAGAIYQEADVDLPPTLIRIPTPKYPAELRQREVPGRVELEYVVGADGRVEPESVRVVTTTHGPFARSATDAMKEAMYEPGIREGARVRVRVRHVLHFRIRPRAARAEETQERLDFTERVLATESEARRLGPQP